MTAALLAKTTTAREERAITVSTPAAVKAFLLKLLELLHTLDTGAYPKRRLLDTTAVQRKVPRAAAASAASRATWSDLATHHRLVVITSRHRVRLA